MVDLVDRDASDRAPYGCNNPSPFAFVDKDERLGTGQTRSMLRNNITARARE